MRPIIEGLVWVGNARDARSLPQLHHAGIRVVVDLAIDEPAAQLSRDLAYCRFPLMDGAEQSDSMLFLAVATVQECLKGGVPTLVACSGGMSRSPAVVAVAIARWIRD
ncbi:Dual specificity phosphatase, catalytic domain [Caulifigura coniformis]|uniref:Dual specificity phosphatase, catalytic domain n=1 Tax=Caulifigura coniformis TaxID=2527983 RepID=A0A517SAW9_9PLAN|nr:dual specificity protein phosphatase [Caulifigura coniformis]QDT53236.1 Dual specificity phosphatase, catalytic domain [Caulifigura coniformis]